MARGTDEVRATIRSPTRTFYSGGQHACQHILIQHGSSTRAQVTDTGRQNELSIEGDYPRSAITHDR